MLYKVIAAALLISSGEALKLNTVGLSRRAAVGKAAALAVPLVAAPAFALERAADAEIYKVRARSLRCTRAQHCPRTTHDPSVSDRFRPPCAPSHLF